MKTKQSRTIKVINKPPWKPKLKVEKLFIDSKCTEEVLFYKDVVVILSLEQINSLNTLWQLFWEN